MKKTTKIAVATTLVAVLALNGCGGGGSSSSGGSVEDDYFALSVPLESNPTTYKCENMSDANYSYTVKPDEFRLDYYIHSAEECERMGKDFIQNFAKDDKLINDEQKVALDYINNIREHIGLPIFHNNKYLQQASLNHERYLIDVYDTYGTYSFHIEDNENYPSVYYTGVNASERAKYAGYDGYGAGEVVSFSTRSDRGIENSLKSLITAIYHRQGLLWNNTNEIGIGGTLGNYFYPHALGLKSSKEEFLKVISTDITIYPYDGQTNVQTTFPAHHEHPDPLPNVDEDSSNPISVSFNNYYYYDKEIDVVSFKVFKDGTDEELETYPMLDKDNDPSTQVAGYEKGLFSERDFALFAKEPFESNTTYRVEFKYTQDGTEKQKVWRFTTLED